MIPQQDDGTVILYTPSYHLISSHLISNNDKKILWHPLKTGHAHPWKIFLILQPTYSLTCSQRSSESREEGEMGPAQTAQIEHEQTQDRPSCYGPVPNWSDLDDHVISDITQGPPPGITLKSPVCTRGLGSGTQSHGLGHVLDGNTVSHTHSLNLLFHMTA